MYPPNWSRYVWPTVLLLAKKYDQVHGADREAMETMFDHLHVFTYCPQCTGHCRHMQNEHPIDWETCRTTKNKLFEYVVERKNQINARLKKREFSLEEAELYFKQTFANIDEMVGLKDVQDSRLADHQYIAQLQAKLQENGVDHNIPLLNLEPLGETEKTPLSHAGHVLAEDRRAIWELKKRMRKHGIQVPEQYPAEPVSKPVSKNKKKTELPKWAFWTLTATIAVAIFFVVLLLILAYK